MYWLLVVKKKDLELIEQVHKSDFELGINFIFDGFDLNDYEIFSTALSNYIMMKITNSNLIIPGVEGIIKLRKEEWIELIGSLCDLGREKIVSIIEFFTYNYEDINADLSLTYFLPSKDNFLLLSEGIFNIQRPAVNALRILAKRQNKAYEKEQNRLGFFLRGVFPLIIAFLVGSLRISPSSTASSIAHLR